MASPRCSSRSTPLRASSSWTARASARARPAPRTPPAARHSARPPATPRTPDDAASSPGPSPPTTAPRSTSPRHRPAASAHPPRARRARRLPRRPPPDGVRREPAAADPGAPAVVVANTDSRPSACACRVARPATDIRPTGRHLPLLHRRHPRGRRGRLRRAAPLEGPTAIAAVGTIARDGATARAPTRRCATSDAPTLSLVAELKPPTLARLWNVAGTNGGARAVRGLAMVPRATRDAPDDTLWQAIDLPTGFVASVSLTDATLVEARPVAALGVTMGIRPAAAALFGGIDQSGGDGSLRARAPPPPCTSRREPRRRDARRVRGGAASPTPPTNASSSFRARVHRVGVRARLRDGRGAGRGADRHVSRDGRGSEGDVVAEAKIRRRPCGRARRRRRDSRVAAGRADRTHPCTTLGDAARELGKWVTGARASRAAPSPRYYPGAAAMELNIYSARGAADLADDLAGEMAARGVLSGAIPARARRSTRPRARDRRRGGGGGDSSRGGRRALSGADSPADAWASIASRTRASARAGRETDRPSWTRGVTRSRRRTRRVRVRERDASFGRDGGVRRRRRALRGGFDGCVDDAAFRGAGRHEVITRRVARVARRRRGRIPQSTSRRARVSRRGHPRVRRRRTTQRGGWG